MALKQPGDLVASWPEADAAFVADEYGNLLHVRHIAVQKQEVLPIIAYGEMLDTDQAISAIYAGAIDCIDLSRHWRNLAQRVELAMRRRSPEFETRLKAMRSASQLAELDRGKRRILGLFAAGKGQQRVSHELGLTEAELEREIDQIQRKLRMPAFKDSVRMMIDYFR
jgi:FixJ family two-component response regulator